MKTVSTKIRSVLAIHVAILCQACEFGNNQQFFTALNGGTTADAGSGSSGSSSSNPSRDPGSTSNNPDPTQSATPSPSSTPDANPTPTATPIIGGGGATPTPTATPVIGGGGATPTPTATPVASPTPVTTPTPVASATPTPTPTPIVSPTPVPTATPSPTPDCTAGSTTENLRIMFMMDSSGSTLTTDPNLHYRVQTVQTFLQNYGSHTNLTYTFGYFNGSSAKEYDSSRGSFVSTPTSLFGDASVLTSALNKYETLTPSGSTPYGAAYSSLQNIVQRDEAAGTKENYVVVFMSDGEPTDISTISQMISLVDSLKVAVAVNGSKLTVSTVYFGPEFGLTGSDATSANNAINMLQSMATEGDGQFVDTNVNSSLQINDIITVPGCH